MNKPLPTCQPSQLKANWVRNEDLKIQASRIIRGSKSLQIRALAKVMRGSNVIGYHLRDEFGAKFAMTSDEIKKAIKCVYVRFFNLKLSSDGKLLHEPAGDILGLDVPPEVFFDYSDAERNLRMYYDRNENHVVLCNTKTREFLQFRICLHNDNRAWFVQCYNGNMIDGRKIRLDTISDVLYRDWNTDVIDKFVDKMLSLASKSKAKTTTVDEDYEAYFESEWNHRFSYLDDYLHGHSENSEKAYHSLMNLRKNCDRYGKTWDIDF